MCRAVVRCAIAVIAIGWMACRSAAPAPTRPAPPAADELDAWADRACACTDATCADQVDRELAAVMPELDVAALLADQPRLASVIAARHRIVRCLWAHGTVAYGFSSLARRTEAEVDAQVCACRDVACARSFYRTHGAQILALLAGPLPTTERDRLHHGETAGDRCLAALRAAEAAPAAPDEVAP